MSRKNELPPELRVEAEARVKEGKDVPQSQDMDIEPLVYELQVHQIELEMQNEQLQSTLAELGDLRDRYRDLFDFAPVGYLVLDLSGVVQTSNLVGARVVGTTRSQLEGTPLARYLNDTEADALRHHLYDAISTEELQSFELRFETNPDVHVKMVTTVYGPGTCLSVLLDVTERRHVQEALEYRKRSLRTILETAVDAVLTLDIDGAVGSFNGGAEAMFGYAADDVIGQSVEMLLHDGADLTRHLDLQAHTAETRVVAFPPRQLMGRRRDGTTFPAEVSLGACEEDGSIAFTAIVRDVTARIEAQERAEESRSRERNLRRRYDALFEGLEVPCTLVSHDLRVLAMNDAALTVSGFQPDEVVGRQSEELFSHADLTPFLVAMRETLETQDMRVVTHSFSGRDRTQWFRVTTFPVPEGCLVLAEDVTEARRLEAELRQAQKMEAVGTLAGGIAHDFNNLLMGIAGCCRLLERESLPAEAMSYVREMLRATERGTDMTRRLLAFARKGAEQPTTHVLDDIIESALPLLRRVVGESVAVDVQLSHTGALVTADGGQLEQVLMNLCINARDAMPAGGELSIKTHAVERGESEGIELVVGDTGVGMDPETLGRVYDPFFTTKAEGKGTGLGLASVYSIVTQTSGHIEIDSAPASGTRVRIWWPVAEAPIMRPTTARPKPSAASDLDLKVLVVDDEALVRLAVRHQLEKLGYEVMTAGSRTEAVNAIVDRDGDADLLVTDVVLPGLSGPELARELTAQHPSLHVIYMSAYPQAQLIESGTLTPTDVFLHKPFEEYDLSIALALAFGLSEP